MFVGMGPKRIRELFSEAKKMKRPVLIFIDEIDALGFKRSNMGMSGNREVDSTLNQLLNEMDGFEDSSQIIVVGATNLIGNLDPALLRPGRFDRCIEVKLPDPHERFKILKIHLKNKANDLQDKEITKIATMIDGFSGAEIENMINQAALNCVR